MARSSQTWQCQARICPPRLRSSKGLDRPLPGSDMARLRDPQCPAARLAAPAARRGSTPPPLVQRPLSRHSASVPRPIRPWACSQAGPRSTCPDPSSTRRARTWREPWPIRSDRHRTWTPRARPDCARQQRVCHPRPPFPRFRTTPRACLLAPSMELEIGK